MLMVFWKTGTAHAASTVTELSSKIPGEHARRLAQALTRFCVQAWRTYTHPASAAEDQGENSEGWRRERHREAFAKATDAATKPNLPTDGGLLQSYNPVEEAAHQVGRALHAASDPGLTARVVAEVQEELAAVERAELGDLTGRSRQAVALTRAGASPAQVHAADTILSRNPLGSPALFTDVDPVAASIAAAHWLQAAADVTAEVSGLQPTQIVVEADNIEALAHITPTAVLEHLELGLTPYTAITGMIRDALIVAEGRIPDIDDLCERIDEAEQLADEHQDPRLREALRREIRTTPLDPMCPAQDLLEDLLDGIRGCWLLYQEDTEDDDAFVDAVRAEANASQDRLT
ncbi:hypothetical protein [Actinomadura vinacea]|uniref:hypothetical protein n=1 Tax=Actinomadura vinacea TaxID=115336 RepID=UPI0031D2F51E